MYSLVIHNISSNKRSKYYNFIMSISLFKKEYSIIFYLLKVTYYSRKIRELNIKSQF